MTRQTQIPYGNDNQNGKDSGLAAPTLVDDEAFAEGGATRLDGQRQGKRRFPTGMTTRTAMAVAGYCQAMVAGVPV
ncbi:hypothetical protein GRAN_2052 [Granulicella sibirica]|uniref:Uncharacterized protein n=1 Tax=Granulicella sibirica TaxID=2479048 RepID=A0A4Q0T6U7_9BACT|nr:hypothetical protein GRAN_2052 [Granulicella sibirica]